MQLPKSIGTAVSVIVLVAACGGGPAATPGPGATQNPGGATQNPGGATTNPGGGGATTDPGGGGGVNTANGKAHFEVSGAASKSGDLGFLPIASHFGGMDQTVLNFTPASSEVAETLTITITAGGTFAAVYTSTDLTVSGGPCTTSKVDVGATTASGSFECSETIAMSLSGGMLTGVVLKGTFEARS